MSLWIDPCCGGEVPVTTTKDYFITVGETGSLLIAGFSANTTAGDAPLAVSFTDTSAGLPLRGSWDFENDNVVDSTERNPSHVYRSAGIYTVKLSVGNDGGSDDEVKVDYIWIGQESTPVPEFPTLALSIILINTIGLFVIFLKRKA